MGGQATPARRGMITFRMYGCSCGREYIESHSWRGYRCRLIPQRPCDGLPIRPKPCRYRALASSAFCCSGGFRAHRCCGHIRIFRLSAAMQLLLHHLKKPFSDASFPRRKLTKRLGDATIKMRVRAPGKPPVLPLPSSVPADGGFVYGCYCNTSGQLTQRYDVSMFSVYFDAYICKSFFLIE
jgi:hypothetical protein